MFLSDAHWLEVVQRTPLVSIDLIVRDTQGRVLLGLRNNPPAQGSWFVPGGVIRKEETLDAAFVRIAERELGLCVQRRDARLLGVYEHHYPDNFAGTPGISTHYVVLAHTLNVPQLPAHPADDQHAQLRAFTVTELLATPGVHANTLAYFR